MSDLAYRRRNDKTKAHRGKVLRRGRFGYETDALLTARGFCGEELYLPEAVPVEQTAPEDRCRRCFPPAAPRPEEGP